MDLFDKQDIKRRLEAVALQQSLNCHSIVDKLIMSWDPIQGCTNEIRKIAAMKLRNEITSGGGEFLKEKCLECGFKLLKFMMKTNKEYYNYGCANCGNIGYFRDK